MNEKSIFHDNAADSGSLPLSSCVCIPLKWATVTQVILTRLDLGAIFSHKVQFHLTGCVLPLMHLTVACTLFFPPKQYILFLSLLILPLSFCALLQSLAFPALSFGRLLLQLCRFVLINSLLGHNLIIRSKKQKNILHSWGFHDNLQSHWRGFWNVIKIEICSFSTSESWEFRMMSEAGWVQIQREIAEACADITHKYWQTHLDLIKMHQLF